MKKYLLLTALCIAISIKGALTIINISQFPNLTVPGNNYQILLAQPGVTNYNMTVDQFGSWLASDTNFIAALKANQAINVSGTNVNFVNLTNTPNFVFTNAISFWCTNRTFVSGNTFNPSPVSQAELIISNNALGGFAITDTLPWTAYSLSLGGPVTQVTIGNSNVIDLKVTYYNGIYYLMDYGKNNSTLYSLATNGTATDAGFLVITNGLISIRH